VKQKEPTGSGFRIPSSGFRIPSSEFWFGAPGSGLRNQEPERGTRKSESGTTASATAGYTFIEITIVAAIIAILASVALPLAKVTIQRNREIELRRALREIRTAIDKYNDAATQNLISPNDLDNDAEGYPPTLQILVDGVTPANDTSGRKLRFLRRIPTDPMTHSTEWGLRSSRDEPDTKSWGGLNVYDVYTKVDGKGLDGTNYRDW
jgi:general secretion pathway protein G